MRHLAILVLLLLAVTTTTAQSENPPRYEMSAQFTSLTIQEPDVTPIFTMLNNGVGGIPIFFGINPDPRTEPGFGGRFTINLNQDVALEAQADFFPNDNGARTYYTGGRTILAVAGVKAGKRFERFGIFGKARPGFIAFNRVLGDTRIESNSQSQFSITQNTDRTAEFAVDLGGVLEFYPSQRIITRFDIGDTVIRYQERTLNLLVPNSGPINGPMLNPVAPVTFPGETKHNFQFSAGIGFRF